VLVLWRNKLRASDRPERIFEAVRAVVEFSGVLAKLNRRALDSTVLDDAVQRQDTISLITSQMRRVRKLVPELRDKVYVREHNLQPGRPPCDFEDQDDIDRLISELVEDANELVFLRRTVRPRARRGGGGRRRHAGSGRRPGRRAGTQARALAYRREDGTRQGALHRRPRVPPRP
jgi:hypothetical protein